MSEGRDYDAEFESLRRYLDESNAAREQGYEGAWDPDWVLRHEATPGEARAIILRMAERAIASCVSTIGSLPPCTCKRPVIKDHWWSRPRLGPLRHSDLCVARDRYDTEARMLMEHARAVREDPTIRMLMDLMKSIDAYGIAGAEYKSKANAEPIT